MSPERWRKIEQLYHEAQERVPAERGAFLAGACAGDDELQRQVKALLAQDSDGHLLDAPALKLLAESMVPKPLSVGDKLGPYEILAPVGAGGMGEVWKARDPRLNRMVAIKVSKEQFSERFARESRAIAALNHPNICTLHDVGPNYLVMELLEGAPLKGPLPVARAVEYAGQILDALDAAHRKGIVHRDLKPANILITRQGAKLVDFGLAKQTAPLNTGDATATMTHAVTSRGQIVGTLQYISPEQLQCREVDARSDIFSFGLVFYEMLTGKRAFEGSNPASLIGAILEREAPALEPEPLDRVVRACLAKDPADRFQTAHDLKRAIEWSVCRDAPGRARRPWLAWGVAAVLAVGLAAVSFLHFGERSPDPAAPVRFQIPGKDGVASFIVSPNGRKIVFNSLGRLWVYSLESGESHDLTATDGGTPFWSPDSRFIGYLSEGALRKIDVTGGLPQTVATMEAGSLWTGGAWSQNDVIVFGDRAVGLFRVPATGGVPVQITAVDRLRHKSQYRPCFLPDGRHFVFICDSAGKGKSAIYLGSVDARPEQQSSQPLVTSESGPDYAPSADPATGYLLFTREGTLMAQPFDNRRLELTGHPIAVAEHIKGGYGSFSVSANDVLVFGQTASQQLTWYDREGKVLGASDSPTGAQSNVALSPDGTQVTVTQAGGGANNIWLFGLSRGANTRFTFDSANDASPVWSPDGSRIIFSSNRDGPFNLYQKATNGVKDEEVLLTSPENKFATSWSRDGRFLLYETAHPSTKNNLWVLPLGGDRKPLPFLITQFDERQAHFSPDAHWVAYTSDESGQDAVYVRSFSMNSVGTAAEAGGKWPISDGYGVDPHWRGDGRELYYRSRNGGLVAVEITTNPAFRAGKPQVLGVFVPAFVNSVGSSTWDSAADGKRFLKVTTSGPQPFTVVLNWQAGLKK